MRILHVGWGFSPWRPGGLIAYAEDLMAAQVARGDRVSYFFSGRHYPYISGPRLKRWRRSGVEMYEVINPPIVAGMEHGTRHPELDISEPRMEFAFGRVLARVEPDVVHIQELHSLPSSFIDVARAAGVPTLMTLQDYFPLCATLRLFDAEGNRCMRRDIGDDCVIRNAGAPADRVTLTWVTLRFHIGRARRLLRLHDVDFSFIAPLVKRFNDHYMAGVEWAETGPGREPPPPPRPDPRLAAEFQRRRDVNVERLGRVDRLVAQSPRVAEIYRTLGVSGARMTTLPFTLGHIERLQPRPPASPTAPLRFVTINGCASPSKGAEVVRGALRALRDAGADGRFRLRVLGHVDEGAVEELRGFPEVDLHGMYRQDELGALLDDVDVGLMPSVWEEALGYTGLEMIAKGIPLIANPLGGITEYAREGETAWHNRSCTGEGMAALMLQLIEAPEQVTEMHRRLRAVRDELIIPMATHVEAIERLYREAAGERALAA